MKNKQFAHSTLFGVLDITKRSYYRDHIAYLEAEMQYMSERLEKAVSQYSASQESLAQAAVDYNNEHRRAEELAKQMEKLKAEVEKMTLELNRATSRANELQGAYNDAKRRLQKWDRTRGKGGRFVRKANEE